MKAFIILSLFFTTGILAAGKEFSCPKEKCELDGVNTSEFVIATDGNSISEMTFTNSSLSSFPSQIEGHFGTLKRLEISKSGLSSLIISSKTNLQYLDASSNKITELSAITFTSYLSQLVTLYLSRNKITTLSPTIFSNMPKLELLDLSFNKIVAIRQENIFGRLTSLKFIYVNGNGMNAMRMSFTNLTNLKEYDGSHNQLTDWSLTFPSESKVILNLAYCELKNTYSSAADKGELTLDGNRIEFLKITGAVSKASANFNRIKFIEINPDLDLQVLELRQNRIIDIQNITRMVTVQVLDLSYNPIVSLEVNAFEKMTELRYLTIRSTSLLIHGTVFSTQRKLIHLDISDNVIGSIDLRNLKYLVNLQVLKIEKSYIDRIKNYEDMKEILPDLNTIAIGKNNFRCNYLLDLINFAKQNEITITTDTSLTDIKLPNIRGINCVGLSELSEDVKNELYWRLPNQSSPAPNPVNLNEVTRNVSIAVGNLMENLRKANEDAITTNTRMVQVNILTKIAALSSEINNLNFSNQPSTDQTNVTLIKVLKVIEDANTNLQSNITNWNDEKFSKVITNEVIVIFLLIAIILIIAGYVIKDRFFDRRSRRNSRISTQELVF